MQPEAQPRYMISPPRAVRIAVRFWIAYGVCAILVGLGALSEKSGANSYNDDLTYNIVAFILVIISVGLGTFALTQIRAFKCGSVKARRTPTIVGIISSITLWPLLCAVPAIVIQYGDSCEQWFVSGRTVGYDHGDQPAITQGRRRVWKYGGIVLGALVVFIVVVRIIRVS